MAASKHVVMLQLCGESSSLNSSNLYPTPSQYVSTPSLFVITANPESCFDQYNWQHFHLSFKAFGFGIACDVASFCLHRYKVMPKTVCLAQLIHRLVLSVTRVTWLRWNAFCKWVELAEELCLENCLFESCLRAMGLHLNLAVTVIFHCVSLQRREGEGRDKGRWKNYSQMKFSTGISGIIIQTCTFNQKGRKNEKKLQFKLEPLSEVYTKGDNYICSNS